MLNHNFDSSIPDNTVCALCIRFLFICHTDNITIIKKKIKETDKVMTRRPKGKLIAYVDKALSIKNYDDGCNYLSKGKYLYNKEITKIEY